MERAVVHSSVFPTKYHDPNAKQEAKMAELVPDTQSPVVDHVLRFIWHLLLLLQSGDVMYQALFLCISLLGCIVSPFFFCGHFLLMATEFHTLRNTGLALAHNATQLIAAMGFAMCVIFIFAVVAFNYLQEAFDQDGNLLCSSMLGCFAFNLNAVRSSHWWWWYCMCMYAFLFSFLLSCLWQGASALL
eukprot:m.153799 g.153799  ORF g.153799 m.153799 type:complete len:188 (+) comp14295_c0_seq14:134-697(+)